MAYAGDDGAGTGATKFTSEVADACGRVVADGGIVSAIAGSTFFGNGGIAAGSCTEERP